MEDAKDRFLDSYYKMEEEKARRLANEDFERRKKAKELKSQQSPNQ